MKSRILKALLWLVDHMAGTYSSLLIIGMGTAFAATTYTVYNVPDMFLYAGINTTETTNIRMTGPIRNGSVVSYPALTGGVIELRQGSKVEHIYYSRAIVDSTTKIITLTGSVIRDLCWNTATTYVGCSAGQSFQRGAQARLVDDNRLFNLSMKLDVANVTTGSGSYRCGSTSQPCLFPSATTTTQKNSFTYGISSGLYPLNFDTTLGVMQYWNGSAWISFGSGATINATETARGAVELANFTELANRTLTGSTNALVVLTPRHLVEQGSGTGATAANLIPLLNSLGQLPISLGGTGTGGLVASGAIMVLQGPYNAPKSLYATAANQVIGSADGRSWGPISLPADAIVYSSFTGSALIGVSDTGEADYNTSRYAINRSTLTKGSSYEISVRGVTRIKSGQSQTIRFYLGSNLMSTAGICGGSSTLCTWDLNGWVTFLDANASTGAIIWRINEQGMDDGVTNTLESSTGAVVISTASPLVLKATGQMDTSSATINSQLIQAVYKRRN